ncbi:alginate O-acetyltransferase [Zestomonas carbonaria]|uniref:Probable alginate O-acetylase AlgJ n=1 Tax=Zestomonas carbonaria TaxID=2762745 RepID=A0A7U7I8I4_9GAMM|nr:alginate O-acetyltransferase [Pseudomonas carbonaria]CAD5107305.1 putative alginate O-acetylase AlgJ [Pseudomonas carbonaria]
MFPVMTSASKLNGIAFCLMLAAMLLYSLPKSVSFLRSQEQALTLFLDGELIRKFEASYDREFPLRAVSVEAWANLQYLLFREGSSGVVLGKDGWLFTNEEYKVPNAHQQVLARHLERIAEVGAHLREHGKRLILIPVPMKVDIYADRAPSLDARTPRLYGEFVEQLRRMDIEVAPVRQSFLASKAEQPLFLRTDTHWTPQGASLAAREFARLHPELVGGQGYRSERVAEKTIAGDLLNFVRFSEWLEPQVFAADTIPVYETSQAEQRVDADQLFGDSEQSIMLVGSSYTKIEDWNFPGFLKEHLKSDLLTTAVEARGPFYAMEEFLAGEYLANGEIKTVIWEFPVRTLLTQQASSQSWQAIMNQFF